jgi:Peptidase M15
MARALGAGAVACALLGLGALLSPDTAEARLPVSRGLRSNSVRAAGTASGIAFLDSLRGRSRKLRARFMTPARAATIPVLAQLFGDDVARRPGVYAANEGDGVFHLITMRPFADKISGRIGSYRIGFFPSEQRNTRSNAYANPEGFVEVTPSNSATAVSEHFRLADFLTHDQGAVWPKYLVLREPLVDKLELVIDQLQAMGVAVNRLHVMSGFRTPQYNAQGVGAGGRVQDSRHQYGDAADVYVVNGGRDWMGDLNRDGRVDLRDARVLAAAADRVEAAHPELVGGVGVYPATAAHGPFVHIDVRGTRARWGAL